MAGLMVQAAALVPSCHTDPGPGFSGDFCPIQTSPCSREWPGI